MIEIENEYELDYDADSTLDPNALDIAWLNQQNLFNKYVKAAAVAEKQVKDFWEEVKKVRSRLVMEANKDPAECLGEKLKPTAPLVEAYYRGHKDHIEAKENLIQAEYERDLIIGAKQAIFGNKAALEGLTKLLIMEYFAGPKMPRDLTKEYTKFKEKQSLKSDERVQQAKRERLQRRSRRTK